jgi:hypothetical protein
VSLWERLRQECLHTFALAPQQSPFSAEDRALLEKIARLLVQRRMDVPALMFMESVGPLNFLGSQVMHGLRPFLELVCDASELERLAILLERCDSAEHLVTLLQQQAASSA